MLVSTDMYKLQGSPSASSFTAETRHLDRLGQLGEFEQDGSTDPEQASSTAVCFN